MCMLCRLQTTLSCRRNSPTTPYHRNGLLSSALPDLRKHFLACSANPPARVPALRTPLMHGQSLEVAEAPQAGSARYRIPTLYTKVLAAYHTAHTAHTAHALTHRITRWDQAWKEDGQMKSGSKSHHLDQPNSEPAPSSFPPLSCF